MKTHRKETRHVRTGTLHRSGDADAAAAAAAAADDDDNNNNNNNNNNMSV